MNPPHALPFPHSRRRNEALTLIFFISGSGLSLMPEGLETAVSIEQMADLIAFLLSPP